MRLAVSRKAPNRLVQEAPIIAALAADPELTAREEGAQQADPLTSTSLAEETQKQVTVLGGFGVSTAVITSKHSHENHLCLKNLCRKDGYKTHEISGSNC